MKITHRNIPVMFSMKLLESNCFEFIEQPGPDVCIYGHHHNNTSSFLIGKPQLITNQLGYVELNTVTDPETDRGDHWISLLGKEEKRRELFVQQHAAFVLTMSRVVMIWTCNIL